MSDDNNDDDDDDKFNKARDRPIRLGRRIIGVHTTISTYIHMTYFVAGIMNQLLTVVSPNNDNSGYDANNLSVKH